MPDLEDYGAILRSGSAAVPDYAAQEAQNQLRQIQVAQAQRLATEQQQQIAEKKSFQTDLTGVLAHPSPENYSALMAKHPSFAASVKDSWNLLDKSRQDADFKSASEVYSAAANGKYDVASGLMQQRVDADKQAGQDTTHDQAILDALKSGDATQQKAALGMMGVTLSAIAGPDKFNETLGQLTKDKGFTLGQGETRYDQNGNPIASVAAKPDFLVVPEGGKAVPLNPAAVAAGGGQGGGGGQTSPGAVATAAPGTVAPAATPEAAIAHVLKHEGGYLPKDGNGYPTNFGINAKANSAELNKRNIADIGTMTKAQAIDIYKEKYWPASGAADLPANLQAPYFDVYIRSPAMAKALLAKSGEDPVVFAQMAKTTFQNLAKNNPDKYGRFAKAWANRDDDNIAAAGSQGAGQQGTSSLSQARPGDPPGTIYGNAKPQARTLTPAETKARGLDAGKVYELKPDGSVSAVGDADNSDMLKQYGISENMTGPDVLARLPGNIASQVKAMAEGRLPMPSSYALAKPYWQRMLQLTAQYDPTFDAATAPARKAAITAFTGNGKAAQIIGSVNRVANHLDLLWNESHNLAGPDTGFGPLNSVLATTGQAFEPQHAKAYDTEVGFVAGELGKIAKAGVVTEGEVNRIINNLSRKQSASTRQSAIQAAVGIISGAVDPLKDQYNSAFTNSSTRPNIPWVSGRAQQVYKKIAGADTSLTGEQADTNSPGASQGRHPPAGATKTATGPNGQKAALVNGHWVVY